MRGSEAVEEVEHGNTSLDSGKVSYCGEVHNFLRVGFSHHSETGLTACINVTVVAENVQGVRSNAARGNVDNAGKEFARDLVHIRDHKEKTLRSRVCSGECTCCERTVNGTGSTCFGLHFDNLYCVTHDVLQTAGGPCIGYVSHNRRRRDGVDGSNFRKRIRSVSGGGVTIHGKLFSCHAIYPP